jgi:geranyl-CoA carboxylase alpha subunit
MVKAVAGGGGRGMRLVHEPGDLPQALERARSEALAGFGDGTLLIERALTHARHVEVQVFADAHGNCIHLGERDCSVQRRHQKIIEEAPSPAVDEALRERLGASAVALARAAGYVGAGTVEFLLQGQDFHLLEMNTRLQVEHPVTEALTGLDLVAWQIRVARGEPLPLAQEQLRFTGHAIEVRLCAEDEHFHPHTGRVVQLREPAPASAFCWEEGSGLRLDHALEPGLEVGLHFDPMLGKVIARGATREEARLRLVRALRELAVLGLPTNRGFLLACLDDEDFVAGRAAVPFLQEAGPRLRETVVARERVAVEAAAGAAFQPTATALPCAWPRPLRWRHRGELHEARVKEAAGSGAEPLSVNGQALQLAVLPPHGEQAGAPRRWHLQWAGIDWFQEDASFEPPATEAPAQAGLVVRAPFNGRVLRVAVQAGDVLGPGSTAVVIESMKLEHALGPAAGQAGLVVAEVPVRAGQQVAPGQVLLRLAAPAAGSEAGSA